jgi:hypothetical protein
MDEELTSIVSNATLRKYKSLIDGDLILELSIDELSQIDVLSKLHLFKNRALKLVLMPDSDYDRYIDVVKELRQKAFIAVARWAGVKGVSEEKAKTYLLDEHYPGKSKLRQLNQEELENMIEIINQDYDRMVQNVEQNNQG